MRPRLVAETVGLLVHAAGHMRGTSQLGATCSRRCRCGVVDAVRDVLPHFSVEHRDAAMLAVAPVGGPCASCMAAERTCSRSSTVPAGSARTAQ